MSGKGTKKGDLLAGRYVVERALGAGSMGEVVLARDTAQDDLPVAVKRVKDPRAIQWLKNEYETLALLSHPNIPKTWDFCYDRSRRSHLFSVEFVPGVPFTEALEGAPFETLLDYTVRLCRALGYVHGRGYIHCDIKPENVLIERDDHGNLGELKLLDFGLAMHAPQESQPARGTLYYMAPEWFSEGVPSPASDWYSVGMLLYYATYERLPFPDEVDAIIGFHVNEPLPIHEAEGVPDWWGALLLRLTAKDPVERLSDPLHMVQFINRKGGCRHRLDSSVAGESLSAGGAWLGREAVLESLLAWLRAAVDPDAKNPDEVVARVRGGDGVGKTRFIEEVKRLLQMEGHDVLYLGLSGGGEPAVRLAHTLSTRLGKPEAVAEGEAREIGGIVGEAVELVLEAAQEGPLVLLLDDVDRGGLTGPAVFSGIARALEFARMTGEGVPPLALVGAAQTGALASVGLDGLVLDLEVGPMTRQELGQFLAMQFSSEPLPDVLMDDLWAVAHGNPRWAGELAAWMLQAEVARITGGRWELDTLRRRKTGLPETMEQAVRGAMAALGEVERGVLAALAAAGTPLRMDHLTTAAGHSPWDVEASVERLVERGYARFEPTGRTFLPVVDSPSIQRVVREVIGEEAWRATHGALLDALGDPDAHARRRPAEVVHHAFGAGRLVLARRWALDGVRELIERCEFERADKAAEVARDAGSDPAEVALLQVRIAILTGHYQDGIKRVWSALEIRDLDTGDRTLLLEALAELYFRKGEYKESLGMLDGAAVLADDAGARRLAALRARVHLFRGDHDEALAAGEAAVGDDDDVQEPLSRCRGLNIIGLIRSYQGDFERAEDALLAAKSDLAACGDRMENAFVLNSLGLLYQKKKDYDEAERYYRESQDLARAAGSAERTNVAGMNLSVLLQERGRYADAISQYRETLRQAYRIEDTNLLMRIYSNLGNVHRYLGILDGAREWAERSLALARATQSKLMIGLNGILIGEIDLLAGQSERALAGTREAMALFEEIGVLDETVECLIDLAACHLELDAAKDALACARDAAHRSREGRLPNHLLRTLLLLARIGLDAPDTAPDLDVDEVLDEARGLLDGAGTPELAWRTYLLGARRAVMRGTGAPDTALTLMDAALEDLAASVPEAYRRAFFARRDRAALMEEMGRLRQVSAALGRTMAIGDALPVGSAASSVEDLRLTRSLVEMNRRLADVTDLEQALEITVDTMIALVDAERGFVLLRRDERFSVVVARNLDGDAIRRSKAKVSRSIADLVLESGEPIVLDDAGEDEYFSTRESVMALRVRSIACLPLVGQQGVVGAIYLDNRFQPGLFTERVVGILDIFARQAALAIENELLQERNREMVDELVNSKQEVERLNKRLQEEIKVQKAVLDETREELGRRQEALEERFHFGQIVGQSRPIRAMFEAMARVARTDVPVLVLGESGTGKELVARALHYNGPRTSAPFVAVNCAALPDNLLESELFGHEKGAFTGAVVQRKGLFTAADGGSLFMDEVGDMSHAMQTKLLRALQEGEFVPVGAEEAVSADVRVIAATNRDLEAMIKEGSFREDLYYRLNVVRIVVPPLRRRTEDIPLLVDCFLATYSERHCLDVPVRIADDALKALMLHSWPGNVRELQSTVWTAAVFAENNVITLGSLESRPEVLEPVRGVTDTPAALDTINLRDLEQRSIREALRQTGGNKAQAARLLGISRRALYNKIEAFGIT